MSSWLVVISFVLTTSHVTRANPVEQAQRLFLDGEPKAAITLLSKAIELETVKTPRAQLIAKLESLGSQMIAEKSQQEFESALNGIQTDPRQSLNRFTQLSLREPHQFEIHLEIVRSLMRLDDCRAGLDWYDKNLLVFRQLKSVELLFAQLLVCTQQRDRARTIIRTHESLKSPIQVHWQSLLAESYCAEKLYKQCAEAAEAAKKANGQYPESHYWLFMARREQGLSANEDGQRYVTLCKVLSNRQKKDFQVDPFLCKRSSEVENLIKKVTE